MIEYLCLLDSRCYIVKIRYKGGIFFYVFVGGIVFVGGVFFLYGFFEVLLSLFFFKKGFYINKII